MLRTFQMTLVREELQSIAKCIRFGVFFYRCEECARMLHIISQRVQISQNVKYWYEICDVLVPILHSVKFAKCEMCGSTKHSYCDSRGRIPTVL